MKINSALQCKKNVVLIFEVDCEIYHIAKQTCFHLPVYINCMNVFFLFLYFKEFVQTW